MGIAIIDRLPILFASFPIGDRLIGGHGDRAHLFLLACIFTDLIRFEFGLIQQFGDPLPDGLTLVVRIKVELSTRAMQPIPTTSAAISTGTRRCGKPPLPSSVSVRSF